MIVNFLRGANRYRFIETGLYEITLLLYFLYFLEFIIVFRR